MTACGGGGGASSNPGNASSNSGSGNAKILLTDRFENKITDNQGNLITSAKEIWVSFSEMALKPVDGEWVTIFNGPPDKSVDLLTLHGKADLVALVDLPPGAYDKARMKITSAWFIDSDGVRHDVTVPSERVTIKFKNDLVIKANDQTEILFDFVPGKSIHLIETGSGKFILRPVVRVKVQGQEITDFTKIEGQIVSVDCTKNQLTLDPRQGDPITVDLQDALIILRDGSFAEGNEGDAHQKQAASLASCQQLQAGQSVEVVGTNGQDGILHASLVQIEAEEPAANHLEFTGTLLNVDCDQQTIRVTFSGGEIDVTLNAQTQITADDQAVPASEVCNRLKAALQKLIEVEGKVENNQVIATGVTLPSAVPVSLSTRVEGTVASMNVTGTEVTGFVLKDSADKSYTVTIDAQTEIKDKNGNAVGADSLLNHQVRVEGKLDTTTTPNPTIKATEVTLLS